MSCWYFGHSWKEWKDIESGKLVMTRITDPTDSYENGNYVVQERVCLLCNKKQLRTVRTTV